jgi:hypothetical protein
MSFSFVATTSLSAGRPIRFAKKPARTSKVACRHDKTDFLICFVCWRFGEGEVCVEVVGRLCKDSGPIDQVHGSEIECFIDLRICEEGLDDVLTIIECTLYCQVASLGASGVVDGVILVCTASPTGVGESDILFSTEFKNIWQI